MKIFKYALSFVLLMLVGMMISYADIKSNKYNEYKKLVEVFDSTQSEFKFYSIKANATIENDISKDDLFDVIMDVIGNLGLEESNIKWGGDEKEGKIFAQIDSENKNISIAYVKEDEKKSYVIVDILDNSGYKDIVDIYTVIEDSIGEVSDDLQIYTCLSGEYGKKLQLSKYDDILNNILYNMNAEEIDRVREDNFVSLTAYSKILSNKNDLDYLGNKINLNIGMRYSEDEEKTKIYVATPIIKLDY